MPRILVFGDSISYGAWDKKGGWVQLLKGFLFEKSLTNPNFDCKVYNLGISGDTTEDLLERFKFEAKQRTKREEEKPIIIFAIGLNDSYFIQSKNGVAVLAEKFKENIQKLINLAQKFSSKIIFIGLTPVDEPKVSPMPWDRDKSYSNENVAKYNEIIRMVCSENNIYFVEIFENLMKEKYKKLLEDGAHPNSDGHKRIFEIVKDFLIENKII